MLGKTRFFCMAVLGCLLIWGSLTPLCAAEADVARLINLLKSKNILTQEEADSLVTELNANAQKERTEMKEEMKVAAGKGEFLPPALRGFKFGTTIYGEWNSKTTDNAPSTNQFNLNRAYLTLTKDFNDWLGMNITTDLFNSVDPADNRNGLEVRLKFAYANINLFGTTTQLGMIPTPSDSYDSAIWPYRVQGNNLWDGQGIEPTSDLGISIQGPIGGYMDADYLKFAAKPFAGKWGGYFVGIYNGPGYNDHGSQRQQGRFRTGLRPSVADGAHPEGVAVRLCRGVREEQFDLCPRRGGGDGLSGFSSKYRSGLSPA